MKQAPAGPDWLHEIKLDGYRMHARLEAGRVKILTRRGNDWTDKYPTVARALAALPTQNAYLDGELCGVLPDGRTAFNLIQNALEHGDAALIFLVFDLLYLDGENLTALPLIDRKSRLEASSSVRLTRSVITTTRSITGCYFISSPVNMASKGSSQSGSTGGTSPTADPG